MLNGDDYNKNCLIGLLSVFFKEDLIYYLTEREGACTSRGNSRGRNGAQSQDPGTMSWAKGRHLSDWTTQAFLLWVLIIYLFILLWILNIYKTPWHKSRHIVRVITIPSSRAFINLLQPFECLALQAPLSSSLPNICFFNIQIFTIPKGPESAKNRCQTQGSKAVCR